MLWTTAEVMTGVIIACLATLRPLIGHFVPAWGTSDTANATTGPVCRMNRLRKLRFHKPIIGSSCDRESDLVYPSRVFSGATLRDLLHSRNDARREVTTVTESGPESGLRVPEAALLEAGSNQPEENGHMTANYSSRSPD